MGYYIHFLTISFGLNVLFCDAAVTVSLINSATGVDTLECRSDGVVSCRIDPYANLMNWVINDVTYATCSPGCIENPIFNRTYSPVFDVANGVFNLTVDSATLNDDSTTFKCDDGSSFDSITIGVVPAYNENNTNINDTDEGKQVECTTTCVQPGVEFEWFTVKRNSSDRKTYTKGQNEMTETAECSLDSACGGVGTGKVSSEITIPTVSNGEERYIEVVVKYKNPDEERTFRFDEIFYFKDESLVNDGGLGPWDKAGIVFGCVAVLIFLIICAIVTWRKIKELPCDSCQESNIRGRKPCLYCNEFLCTKCKQKHLQTHKAIRFNHKKGQAFSKLPCDSCNIEKKGRKQCSYCYKFICNECTNKHFLTHEAEKKEHKNETTNNEKKQELPCDLCNESKGKQRCLNCHDFLCDTCTQADLQTHHAIISNYKYGHPLNNNNFFEDRFNCSHTENNVESYCLSCEQYLCKWCIRNHADHRILRHSQQGAGKAGFQIFCKFCQNISIKEEARHYSKCDGSFFCEDGRTEKLLGDIIAVNDDVWKCIRCSEHQAECKINSKDNLCVACFLKQLTPYDEQLTEDKKAHANFCALRPAFYNHDVNKLKADVFCLVCNEYLCKNCFKQHLDLRSLWINKFLTNKRHLTPHKTKEDKDKLRASCHSFTDHTGTSNSGAYENVQNVPETGTSGTTAMYEKIKAPGSEDKRKIMEDGGYEVPEITMSAKENEPGQRKPRKLKQKQKVQITSR